MDLPNKSDTGPQTPPAPKKQIVPVGTGAHTAKRPATRRFLDYAFAESPKVVGAKIGRDIVAPRIKSGIEEALNSFLHGMLWGGTSKPVSGLLQQAMLRPGGAVNYAAVSSPTPASQALVPTKAVQGGYQDVVCPSQEFAEALLASIVDLHNQYRVVAVGDLYEFAGLPVPVSANAYGWTNLDQARISKVRDGYVLELPRPSLI